MFAIAALSATRTPVSPPGTRIFDPGLQPERTELAWRRTALSLSVGSLLALKLLPEALDSALGVLPGVVGFILASSL
ncbi:DUF202 domain-containing protein [Microbacterium sp. M]|uniref:DUF202 domain-containing protein n=1 Tax=Microbacterium sp. M TaxID=3377125 RepID=UPI00386DD241